MSNYATANWSAEKGYAPTEFPPTPADNSPIPESLYMIDPVANTLGCRARRVSGVRDRRWSRWVCSEWRCGKILSKDSEYCRGCNKNFLIYEADPDYKKIPAWSGNYDEDAPDWVAVFSAPSRWDDRDGGGKHAAPKWLYGAEAEKKPRRSSAEVEADRKAGRVAVTKKQLLAENTALKAMLAAKAAPAPPVVMLPPAAPLVMLPPAAPLVPVAPKPAPKKKQYTPEELAAITAKFNANAAKAAAEKAAAKAAKAAIKQQEINEMSSNDPSDEEKSDSD
jgi:hypothetical protein